MRPIIGPPLRATAAGAVAFTVSFLLLKIVVDIYTVPFRRQWPVWYEDAFATAFSIIVAVIVGRFTLRPEGISRIGRFYWILLVPACLLTLLYSQMGFVGAGFGGSLRYGLMNILEFPLFLFVFVSLKYGVRLLWLYLVGMFVLHLLNSYQFPLRPDRGLVTVVILTQVAYLLKKRRQHT
jgi:hypothetical protein